jgi:hypothetical protein
MTEWSLAEMFFFGQLGGDPRFDQSEGAREHRTPGKTDREMQDEGFGNPGWYALGLLYLREY